jgi:hypothetical protein
MVVQASTLRGKGRQGVQQAIPMHACDNHHGTSLAMMHTWVGVMSTACPPSCSTSKPMV